MRSQSASARTVIGRRMPSEAAKVVVDGASIPAVMAMSG
jgi:hypothetical protein